MHRPTHYFDHNATTPPDPRVVEAMLEWLGAFHGNPSSVHGFGQAARAAVEMARREVAQLLAARPEEVVFTSSGSEANNTVIFGIAREVLRRRQAGDGRQARFVVSSFEHPSVLAAMQQCAEEGAEVVRIAPRADGIVRAADFAEAIGDAGRTDLVALMLANNELGTVQPVAEVAAICQRRQTLLLCDAVQAAGKIAVDVTQLGADLVVIGGHKFHGPIGAAALWSRTGVEIPGWLVGGGQERRRRASTENVPAIVGLGRACDLARAELQHRASHLGALQRRFEAGLRERIVGCSVHCQGALRLPNTTSVCFDQVSAQELLIRLDLAGFAVSTGSACASGTVEASPTLLALGSSVEQALSTLRFSFGMPNTREEVDLLLGALAEHVEQLRAGQAATGPRRAAAMVAGV